jgi:hypothetical protein
MGGPGCNRGPTGNGWMYTDVHYMSDMVSSGVIGIWFQDTTHGVIADTAPGSSRQPGALFHATGPVTVDDAHPIFDGASNAYTTMTSMPVAVQGLLHDPSGALVALTNLDVHLASTDMGQTFSLVSSGLMNPSTSGGLSLGAPVWISSISTGGWVFVDAYAQTFRTTSATLPSTMWTAHHSPQNMTPSQCMSTGSAANAWSSPDGQTVLITDGTSGGTVGDQVCRSTNAGVAFADVALPNAPAGAAQGMITTMIFNADGMHGVLAGGGGGGSAPYVYTTANGGTAWTASTIPMASFGNGSNMTPLTAFYGDAMHVWIAGSITVGVGDEPLLWASTDGGRTFTDVSTTLTAALGSVFGGYVMHSTDPHGVEHFTPAAGFALTNNHDIWIGGLVEWEDCQGSARTVGFLMYSPTGGT